MTALHRVAAFTLPLATMVAAAVAAGLVCEILRAPQTPRPGIALIGAIATVVGFLASVLNDHLPKKKD